MSKWVLGHPSWMVRKLHPHTPKSDNAKKLVIQRTATISMTMCQQKSSRSSTVVRLLHQTVFDQ